MSHRLNKEDRDALFEQFLKESVSDDSVDLSTSKEPLQATSSQKSKEKAKALWWQDDDDEEHSSGATAGGPRKSFRKSLRTSQPVFALEEDPGGPRWRNEGLDATFLTRVNSKTEESVRMPAVNMTNVCLDTQETEEEEEEKARFFAQIETEASSTIDYSKLNRELDSTSSTMDNDQRKVAVEQNKEEESKVGVTETAAELQDSPHYSENSKEEQEIKELLEKPKMSPILERVSLDDSLEVFGGDDRMKDTDGSLDRGQLCAQSGGSEMEALQEAYRQIHATKDSNDQHYLSLKEQDRIIRPISPSSPPKDAQHSLQLASTRESDLPTAEELLVPIRPVEDQTRGFSLHPFRAEELNKVTISQSMTPESELHWLGKTGPATGFKGVRDLKSSLSRSPDPPDLTWSVRMTVDNLMQEQNNSSQTGKAKKQQASYGSSASHLSASSEKKSTGGRTVDRRAAVNFKSSRMSKAATAPKTHPPKTKSTKNQEKDDRDSAESELKVNSELLTSVQSLVAVLQQQKDSSGHQDAAEALAGSVETRLSQPSPHWTVNEDRSVVEELRVQLAQKERELQTMKDCTEEISSLKQQNYLLQSKLRSAEEANQKRRRVEAVDPVTEEKLQQIDKEMTEQETLIKGYQQENEKLYVEMKSLQTKSKVNEEAMFHENQRLLSQLVFTQEQLRKATRPLGSVCLMNHTQHISDLSTQIGQLQKNQATLSEDNQRLEQEKRSLMADLQLMKKERDVVKAQASSSSGDETLRVLEEKHRQEVAVLKKKLQSFAEKQALLDRDAVRLKTATDEILQLKEQVEKLKQEVVKRSSVQQKAARDTKRIQDLERQVKQLEEILRSKNPNSLPALIYAAATAAGNENVDSPETSSSSRINSLLERRIQRLEANLESHDEEAKRSLQAMEQQFHRLKLRYENRIHELELQLDQRQQVEAAPGPDLWRSKCQTLEDELQHVKDNQQEKEKYLQDQIKSLQKQVRNKSRPSPGRHQRQAEAAFGARIERLNQELAAKTKSIQELSRTLERIQKERRNILSAPKPPPSVYSTDGRQQPRQTGETFPPAQHEKTYQPTAFTGSHITEVLQENEALKQQVELLQLETKQKEDELRAEAVLVREELCRLKEHHAEQLSSVKVEHLRELDRVRASYTLEHSSYKTTELTNKLHSQEVAMKHLQEQLKELQRCKEALAESQRREGAQQKQLTRLLQDLQDAREAQGSEVKLLSMLERKITTMELRQQHREEELQQVIQGVWHLSTADLQSEVDRWRHLAQSRSRELDAFRTELDSILDILRHLQTQGVSSSPQNL